MRETPDTTIILRLPRSMKKWLQDRARSNDRNMTTELRQIMKALMENEPKQGAENAR